MMKGCRHRSSIVDHRNNSSRTKFVIRPQPSVPSTGIQVTLESADTSSHDIDRRKYRYRYMTIAARWHA